MELIVCLLTNTVLGVIMPMSLMIFLPFLIFNLFVMKILPENWAPPVIVFLSVVFLGALDIITTYQVVNVASVVNETNLVMRQTLVNPLSFTALKMGENIFSATIIFVLMTMRGRSSFINKAGYIAGVFLVLFMMIPPVNNFVVYGMLV